GTGCDRGRNLDDTHRAVRERADALAGVVIETEELEREPGATPQLALGANTSTHTENPHRGGVAREPGLGQQDVLDDALRPQQPDVLERAGGSKRAATGRALAHQLDAPISDRTRHGREARHR